MVNRIGNVAVMLMSAAAIGMSPLSHVFPVHATVLCASVTTEGIDVSSFQGTINWKEVAAAGKHFAYVRVNSGLIADTSAATNLSNARAAGVQVGAVDLGRPGADATQEANFFLSQTRVQPGDLVPALDLEFTDGKSSSQVTAWVQTWTHVVGTALGTKPVVYTSAAFWNRDVGSTQFATDPLWDAAWGVSCPNTPAGWTDWSFWQYNNAGSVPGIAGTVDLDRFQGTDFTAVTMPMASSSNLGHLGHGRGVSKAVCKTVTKNGKKHRTCHTVVPKPNVVNPKSRTRSLPRIARRSQACTRRMPSKRDSRTSVAHNAQSPPT